MLFSNFEKWNREFILFPQFPFFSPSPLFSPKPFLQITFDVCGPFLLDAIASPSSYPCQWVVQWSIVSDLEIAIASPSFASLFLQAFPIKELEIPETTLWWTHDKWSGSMEIVPRHSVPIQCGFPPMAVRGTVRVLRFPLLRLQSRW